ncbi:hypothetical protein ACIBP6_39525 [Nonomuraea terrae]
MPANIEGGTVPPLMTAMTGHYRRLPGQYGDTVKTTFDQVAGWLTDHRVS